MAKKNKYAYYVVWRGRTPGVYDSWDDCEKQVKGFTGALFKGFADKATALDALHQDPAKHLGQAKNNQPNNPNRLKKGQADPISLSVDAACSRNPGRMEYRGVDTGTGAEVFRVGPFEQGTSNIGEFLAIVHGLAFLKERSLSIPVYTDSKTALKWVKDKKANTKLEKNKTNEHLFQLIKRAELWLLNNTWNNPVLKWETQDWGEIPADFGRK